MVEFDSIAEAVLTGFALVLSIMICMSSFAWGYAGMGGGSIARWIIAFGILWLFSQWRGVKWFSALGLLFSMLLAIAGLWLSFPIGWMFSGAVFALFAWDMTDLRQKLRLIPLLEDIKGIERRHLARVSVLALGSLLFASMLMLWWRQWTSDWGIFLLSVTVLGLTQIIAWFRK